MDVVCVGDCGVDHYLPSGERLFGGITANFARHARDVFPVGDRIRIVSSVGDDDAATLVQASLADTSIDCLVTQQQGATPVQYIRLEPNGERTFVRYDEGVLGHFRFTKDQVDAIADSDLLVTPVYLQIAGLFDALMSIGTRGRVSVDFADFQQHPDFGLLEKYIDRIDVGFFGMSRTDDLSIGRIRELAARHGKLLVVTLGADGSRAFDADLQIDCAAVAVDEVVDTTGAGDAYSAAFLSAWLHGAGVAEAMQRGAQLAAGVVARMGSH
jgi:fructoselysine 6-kinase